MKTYECNICGTRYSISMEGRAFTYAGKAYVIGGDSITQVSVVDFYGKTCRVCAGLARQAVAENGIRYGGDRLEWIFWSRGAKCWWTGVGKLVLLSTFTENVGSAIYSGRIPIPRFGGGVWGVRCGGIKITLDSYGARDFSPWPGFWDPLPDFPLVWAGLGMKVPGIRRDKETGAITIHGREFPNGGFPTIHVCRNEIPMETWEFLAAHGHGYAICRDGIVYVPSASLV